MVSWFVKQALLDVATDTGLKADEPTDARRLGAADAVASASRASTSPSATPSAPRRRSRAASSSTPGRSRASSRKGCSRRSSAGARTRRRCRRTATRHDFGCDAAIYLTAAGRRHARALLDADRAGAARLPRHAQRVDLDRGLFHRCARATTSSTGRPATTPITRATTPCCRCTRWRGGSGSRSRSAHILDENEIVDGIDELGVLLYGHTKNAYWYGSQLSIEETRRLAPYQNATGLQVTSAVLAGMVWALENPERRHRRGRRDGFPPLPRGPAALSRAGDRALHRLDAAPKAAASCSRRTSTAAIRGSSGTCWCG